MCKRARVRACVSACGRACAMKTSSVCPIAGACVRVRFDQRIFFVYLFFDVRMSGSVSVSDFFSPPDVSFLQGGADTADVDHSQILSRLGGGSHQKHEDTV